MLSSAWAPFSRHVSTGCQALGTSAHSVCQPDSWVTGVKCGSEAEADWTIWVGASYIKRFRLFLEQPPPLLSQSTQSLTLHLDCFKSSFSAGEYQPPAGSVTAPSVCRWHTTHTWKHRVGSHGAAGCGNPANSGTLTDFERQKRWHFPPLVSWELSPPPLMSKLRAITTLAFPYTPVWNPEASPISNHTLWIRLSGLHPLVKLV